MTHVEKLDIQFDLPRMLSDLDKILHICSWHPDHRQIGLTHSLGDNAKEAWYDATGSLQYVWGNDAVDEHGHLRAKHIIQNESDFSYMVQEFKNTVFAEIIDTLRLDYALGRVRLMMSRPKSCLSWHTDNEKRLHIPLVTNLGAHLVIENEANHLPADGSVYIANTTLYHTAFNAGLEPRIHLVACVLN
jgi:hypothetical protein